MPQHLWHEFPRTRFCEVCYATQTTLRADWSPPLSTICPGDPDDGGRRVRLRPHAPSGDPKVLELA